jgi:hypothetical protein
MDFAWQYSDRGALVRSLRGGRIDQLQGTRRQSRARHERAAGAQIRTQGDRWLWVRRDHLGNPANFWIVHLESSAVSRCERPSCPLAKNAKSSGWKTQRLARRRKGELEPSREPAWLTRLRQIGTECRGRAIRRLDRCRAHGRRAVENGRCVTLGINDLTNSGAWRFRVNAQRKLRRQVRLRKIVLGKI